MESFLKPKIGWRMQLSNRGDNDLMYKMKCIAKYTSIFPTTLGMPMD